MRLAATARFGLRVQSLDRLARGNPRRVVVLQEGRLRSLLAHAVRRSPFYRAKYAGLDVARCPLAELPPTNKGELMDHFDDVVTAPPLCRADLERFVDDPANCGRLFGGRWAVSHTSGSQGQPLLLVQDGSCLDLLFALQLSRGNASTSVSLGGLARRVWRPARLAAVLMKEGFYPSASAFDHMPTTARRLVSVLRVAPTDADLVDRLHEFRPTVIIAYASVLEDLARAADHLGLAPDLRQVVNSSEELTARARARLEGAFGVPVLDTYACGECPFLSTGCPAGPGMHVNADWVILEVVDEAGCPVAPGTPGQKVYLTNLANTVQPMIRYELSDRVTLADSPCGCRNRLPRIAHVQGRSFDTFWVEHGGRHRLLLGSVFKNALDYLREVREWQAVQEERNRVRVRLELLPGARLDRERACRVLNRQLEMFGFDGVVDIELEVVPELRPDDRTGKFRRIISRVGPPAPARADAPVSR